MVEHRSYPCLRLPEGKCAPRCFLYHQRIALSVRQNIFASLRCWRFSHAQIGFRTLVVLTLRLSIIQRQHILDSRNSITSRRISVRRNQSPTFFLPRRVMNHGIGHRASLVSVLVFELFSPLERPADRIGSRLPRYHTSCVSIV